MSKVAKYVKKSTKKAPFVLHPPFVRTQIPAQLAKPVPPLGNQLGVRNVNVPNFCKEFNERTSHIKEGVKIPCHIFVNADRTFRLEMIHPTTYELGLMAVGAKKGSISPKIDPPGILSLKHIYEIAKLRHEDINQRIRPLQEVCLEVIWWCRRLGIIVKDHVTAEEINANLERRKVLLKEREDQKLVAKKTK